MAHTIILVTDGIYKDQLFKLDEIGACGAYVNDNGEIITIEYGKYKIITIDNLYGSQDGSPGETEPIEGPFMEEYPGEPTETEIISAENNLYFHPGSDEMNLKELQKADATIKALRKRSLNKAEKNIRLSGQLDLANSMLSEKDRDYEDLLKDNKGLKNAHQTCMESISALETSLMESGKRIAILEAEKEELNSRNEYHKGEVEKGNEYRQGLKDTIESLHEQIRGKDEEINNVRKLQAITNDELNRYRRIIDLVTIGNKF